MRYKGTGKADGRKSSWKVRPATFLIACLVVIILACIPLLPLVALVVVLPAIGRIFESIGESLGIFLTSLSWLIGLIAYAIWLFMVADYARLARILPELIDWLRSIGLI
jgi:hypothetical protein